MEGLQSPLTISEIQKHVTLLQCNAQRVNSGQ